MGDTSRSMDSRLLTAPEFFTQSQIHSSISCNIKPNTTDVGKYSDVRMAKALSVIEPYLMEDEEDGDVVEYNYQVYEVKRERTASFFFRPLYHASELSVLHPPCTEEEILLEVEVLRHSSSYVLCELFSKCNYSGQLVFEVWWVYSLCRLNHTAKRSGTSTGLNDLTSYTSVRILIALIRFYDRCLADNWSALYPDRRMTAAERIQDLKKTHRLDVLGNIALARKVINECGKPEMLDSALADLERQVATEKRDPQKFSNAEPNTIGGHGQGNILRNVLGSPPQRGGQLNPVKRVSQSTASGISHQYRAPDEKPIPCMDSSSPDCIFSVSKPTGVEGGRAGILSDDGVCAVCQERLFSTLGAPVVTLIKSEQRMHLPCLAEAMKHSSTMACPVTNIPLLPEEERLNYIRGDMPSGSMTWRKSEDLPCSGYFFGTITILYRIPRGCQKPYHPSPGQSHQGTCRTAYLPDTEEGNKLLTRLRAAFLCGFTFRVGTSLTTNIPDQVTWGSVHHKTSLHGGPARHGYPDEDYISRCNSELTALHIPGEAVCASFVSRHEIADPAASDALFLASRQFNVNDASPFLKQNVSEIFGQITVAGSSLMSFLGDVWTDRFKQYVEQFGISGVTVEPVSDLVQTELFKNFVVEGNKCCAQSDIRFDVRLAFHGTAENNIQPILRDGLDPSLRHGQRYGQGEYFGTNPSLSLVYCKGGHKMIVFAIITHDNDIKQQYIAVINKRERQLPVAVLSFESCTLDAMKRSHTFQQQVTKLLYDAKVKAEVARQARSKERIIQLLLQQEYLAASDVYNRSCDDQGIPPKAWAEEIAVYVHDHIRNAEEVAIYFPNLPARSLNSSNVNMLDANKCEKEALEAKARYESVSKRKFTG